MGVSTFQLSQIRFYFELATMVIEHFFRPNFMEIDFMQRRRRKIAKLYNQVGYYHVSIARKVYET